MLNVFESYFFKSKYELPVCNENRRSLYFSLLLEKIMFLQMAELRGEKKKGGVKMKTLNIQLCNNIIHKLLNSITVVGDQQSTAL